MSPYRTASALTLMLVSCLVGRAGRAHAHELVGAALPPLVLEDLHEQPRTITFPSGRLPIVLVWEDDASSKQKQPAHAVVGRYSDNVDNRSVFELIAVADMARWSWWPARKHALAAIRKSVANAGTGVWIDWVGGLRKAYGLKNGQSAFFVIGSDGHVRWFAQGQLDAAQARSLDGAIAALGARPAPGR